MLLLIITIELTLIYAGGAEERKGSKEEVKKTRRDIYGVFANPLGDSYRKNSKELYVPIKPGSKMLDGDEEDEV